MSTGASNPEFPARNRPAHQPVFERQNLSVIVFLTVCTKDRRPILANDLMHTALRAAWIAADHWLVGRYMVMPDHIHLFCAPGSIVARPLGNWVRHWKTGVAKAIGAREGATWQIDHWDTQLRSHESYAKKWEYVRNNPVRAGLVPRSEDWPYQGELNVLRWHE